MSNMPIYFDDKIDVIRYKTKDKGAKVQKKNTVKKKRMICSWKINPLPK